MLNILLGTIVFIIILVVVALIVLRNIINDNRVKTKQLRKNSGDNYLVILAHPDDEVMIAGTISKLVQCGNKVSMLYLTHGEDGSTGGIVKKSDLGKQREKELYEVKGILQVESLKVFDYPDRYVSTVDKNDLAGTIDKEIRAINPDYIITFDDSIGLYGHSDHRTCGEVVRKLAIENEYSLKEVYIMTLPESMIKLAMKMSQTFKDNYNGSKGLPNPDFAIDISRFGKKKLSVIKAHKTQWQSLGDVQPLYNKIPYWVYYRIFCKEYFSTIIISNK